MVVDTDVGVEMGASKSKLSVAAPRHRASKTGVSRDP